MTFRDRNIPDDTVAEKNTVYTPEKITAVIGQWADYIRTDFDTGDVTVPDGKGGWKYWCKAWEL